MSQRVTPHTERLGIRVSPELEEDIKRQAKRLERSMSWVVRQAWRIARPEIVKLEENERKKP